jgi:hypothetical protein
MISLLAAYVIATIAISAYGVWVIAGAGRAQRRLRELQPLVSAGMNGSPSKKVA